MPKKNKKSSSVQGVSASITREAFRVVTTSSTRTSTGNTFTQYNLTAPNLGDRGSFISENFEFFRVVSLRVSSILDCAPVATGAAGAALVHAVGFMNTPAGSTTAPTSNALMSQQAHYNIGPAFHRISIRAGRSDLLDEPMKWFNTFTTGSVPASTLSAGTVTGGLFAGFSATEAPGVTQYLIIEGVVEFHTPIDSTDSFRRRVPRAVLSLPAVQRAVDRLDEAIDDAVSSSSSTSATDK